MNQNETALRGAGRKFVTFAAMMAALCTVGGLGYYYGGIDWGREITHQQMETYRAKPSDQELYVTEEEEKDFVTRYGLPALSRMGAEESAQYVEGMKVVQRAKNMELTMDTCMHPEKRWKTLYQGLVPEEETREMVLFEGKTSKELNAFLRRTPGSR